MLNYSQKIELQLPFHILKERKKIKKSVIRQGTLLLYTLYIIILKNVLQKKVNWIFYKLFRKITK